MAYSRVFIALLAEAVETKRGFAAKCGRVESSPFNKGRKTDYVVMLVSGSYRVL